MAECLIDKRLPVEFGVDRYMVGYLSHTAAIMADSILNKDISPKDRAFIAFHCLRLTLKDISPTLQAYANIAIYNDDQYKLGVNAAQIVMCEVYGFSDFDDNQIVIEARELAEETGEPSVAFLMQNFFFGYIKDKYS